MSNLSGKDTLGNQIADKLELFVLAELKPGDRLPPERELAQNYGVSRTVVREAVHALTARGLLEVRSRSGVVVSTPTAEQVSHSITSFLRAGFPELDYRKVMEVRLHLEVQIAALAAERRTDHDLRQMERILESYIDVRVLAEFVRWDMAFHAALAQACMVEKLRLTPTMTSNKREDRAMLLSCYSISET